MEEISPASVESIAPKSSGAFLQDNPTSKLSGNFKPIRAAVAPTIDLSTFKAAPAAAIQTGQRVLHIKFGEGRVLNVDGANDNRVATIEFPLSDEPKKRIMLNFAKLQILE